MRGVIEETTHYLLLSVVIDLEIQSSSIFIDGLT